MTLKYFSGLVGFDVDQLEVGQINLEHIPLASPVDLLVAEMEMSSSSSLVSLRCWMLSNTTWSIAVESFVSVWGYQRPSWDP